MKWLVMYERVLNLEHINQIFVNKFFDGRTPGVQFDGGPTNQNVFFHPDTAEVLEKIKIFIESDESILDLNAFGDHRA